MNTVLIQKTLDETNGPVFRDNRYLTPIHPKQPLAKWKSHGRNGRNIETKIPRSNA